MYYQRPKELLSKLHFCLFMSIHGEKTLKCKLYMESFGSTTVAVLQLQHAGNCELGRLRVPFLLNMHNLLTLTRGEVLPIWTEYITSLLTLYSAVHQPLLFLQILSEENHSGWNLWAAFSNPWPVSCGSPSDSYQSVVQALAQEFCFAVLVPEITTTLSPFPADAELVANLESPPPILDWAPAPY